ncbi:MAG: hypothetical protein U0637_03605 [Phycisphaerales bacterium]
MNRLIPVGATLLLAALCGCSSLGFAGGSPAMVSPVTGDRFSPALPTRVFTPSTAGVADFYLTDLPADLLAGGGDLAHAAGTIVHVHLFTKPSAGKTPIATDATTAIIRVYVLAGGQAGMYGGGGFFSPSGSVLGKEAGGSTREATLHLTQATGGFEDAIGPTQFSGSFAAKRDDAACERLRLITQALEGGMGPVR